MDYSTMITLMNSNHLGIVTAILIFPFLTVFLLSIFGYIPAPKIVYDIYLYGVLLSMGGAVIILLLFDKIRFEKRKKNLKNFWINQLEMLKKIKNMDGDHTEMVNGLIINLESITTYVQNVYAEVDFVTYLEQIRDLRQNLDFLVKHDISDFYIDLESIENNIESTLNKLISEL